MLGDPNRNRIYGRILPLDYSATRSFFETRGKLAAESPLTAVMYQDTDLATRRDCAEKHTALPLLHLGAGDRVLDLGCGPGRWAESAVPLADAYLGVDFSASLLEVARAHFPSATFQLMNVAEFGSDALIVPPPFTLAICSGILTYMNDADVSRLFIQLSRIMAQPSRLYLREPMAKERRLTLDDHWSDALQSKYSAIYRTRPDYLALLEGLEGFRITSEGEPFPTELQNRTETEQRYILLER
jgi:SAM-dependent methyltransferase